MGRGLTRFGPAALAALGAALPFVRSVAAGESLFFRDASRTFFPIKAFVAEGLRRGELRFWNPYLNEGTPLHLPPVSYPLDLLHALRPDPAFFTLLLVLHLPLAAAAGALLLRRLGCGGAAAFGGGTLYALGGFALSTLNLYVYAQALPWAPLVVLGLLEAGSRRGLATAALAAFAAASTGAVEVLLQTLVIGGVLAFGRPIGRSARGLAAAGLGIAVAAPSLFVMRAQLGGSARGAGLPIDVVVSQSVDPWSLPQIVIGDWHGALADPANHWWGSNFFPNGFPYILSLYLGVVALLLAGVGLRFGGTVARRLGFLAALGLVASLGRFIGIGAVLAEIPVAIPLRFPVKAFFTVHLGVALLGGLGLQALRAGRGWRALCAALLAAGGALIASTALPAALPGTAAWFLQGFLPPGYSWPDRIAVGRAILADTVMAGWIALGGAAIALAVVRAWIVESRGVALLAALLAADLLRTGSGLNPTVTSAFFQLSPEVARVADDVRAARQRLFSCDLESSPAYFRARAGIARHDVWSFALAVETLTPDLNVGLGVPTALSRDLTMMVPEDRVLPPEQLSPAGLPQIRARLRAAGVSRVVCPEPVPSEGLRPLATLAPRRVAPLRLHVYAVEGSLPLRALEGADGEVHEIESGSDRVVLDVEATGPARLVVRDAMAPGWTATVDGRPAPIDVVESHYRGVSVPAGRCRVEMRYAPPGLRAGLAVAAGALAGLALLLRRAPPRGD